MGIIDRYLIKAHIAPFIFGTFTVVFLFFFQFLILNLDKLIGKGLDNLTILQLIAYQMPAFIVLAVPMGVLFGTVMAFGSMSANHEITIIKASGGSLIRMMIPILILGAGLTYFLYWFNNEVLPDSNHAGKLLMRDITQKKPTFGLDKGQFSNQLDGFTILPREIDSSSGLMRALTIYDNREMDIKNIISADSGYIRYDNSSQKMVMDLFYGEIIQYPENNVNNVRKIDFEKYRLFTEALDFDLNRSEESQDDRGDRELKIIDMQKRVNYSKNTESKIYERYLITLKNHLEQVLYISKRKVENQTIDSTNSHTVVLNDTNKAKSTKNNVKYDTLQAINSAKNQPENKNLNNTNSQPQRPSLSIRRDLSTEMNILYNSLYGDAQLINANRTDQKSYLVEIHKKYAIPFACLVFVLIGCPLGIRSRGGNFGISAGISLGFFILYWACLIAGEKLADRAIISPWFGMWLGNIIVGILGIILTLKVNNENLSILSKLKQYFPNKNK